MLADQLLQGGHVVLVLHRFQADRFLVDPLVEVPVLIQHIGDAAGHTGRKVLAGGTQHHHGAAGHVLTAVVAHALHDGGGTAVAHGKALTGHAGDEGLAAGGTVQGHVAGDDVLFRLEGDALRRAHNDLAAGQALAHVVVAVAHQVQRQATRDERAEALAAGTHTVGGEHVIRQGAAVLAGDLAAKDGTKGAVGVGHVQGHALGVLLPSLNFFMSTFMSRVFSRWKS